MRFKFYAQQDRMDCGPACIKMIARYYGRSLHLQTLREMANLDKDGVNLLGISDAAEAVGFRTQAVSITYGMLRKNAASPCILHWHQNHFVVLYKITRKYFFIANPAVGLVRLTPNEFISCWKSGEQNGENTGIALLLSPTPDFFRSADELPAPHTSKNSKISFEFLFWYIYPYKKLILQLFAGLGITSLLQLLTPFLTQSIVDVGINTANLHFIYIVLFGQIALLCGRFIVDVVRGNILLYISSRINISILTDFLIKLMKLPVRYFESKRTGDLLQRMNDHQKIESFLTGSSINVLFSVFSLLVFSVVLATFNGAIFEIFIIASLAYSLWVYLFMKKRRTLNYRQFTIAAREQGAAIQLILGMQEIKLNGIEKPMRWKWEAIQAKIFNLNRKNLALSQWQQGGAFVINEGKNLLITFFAAKSVIDGHMTLGTMLAVQYIIGQLNSPIEQMINFAQSWQNAKISMERLNEVHAVEDEEPEDMHLLQELPQSVKYSLTGGAGLMDPDYPVEPDLTGGSQGLRREYAENVTTGLKIQGLSFSYSGRDEENVLYDINFTIPKGKTTAIVGLSGSGKTTLLKLLLKFYEPTHGNILLDGLSLKRISHRAWRKRCGVVMQESFIFSDTIARNIAVGNARIDMRRLAQAIELSNAAEFIENMPLGYYTQIGPDGIPISMGQRQRILIARAIYRDPEYIFFDEATNSLDANNE
ncbi:MAG TPA: peptidase domain-containing ABC transporter, partial [Puia sp.]